MTGMGSPGPVIFRASAGGAITYHIPDNSKCWKALETPFDPHDAMNSGNFGKIGGTATSTSGAPEMLAEGVGTTVTTSPANGWP